MRKAFILVAALVLSATAVQAQKYGHINFGNLISAMPETDAADAELEAYQKQLVQQGEQMAEEFQEEYGQFVTEVQSGSLPPKQQQEQQAKLQAKQQEILAYEQQIRQMVQEKRQELLAPIVERAEAAVQEVAKENGFVMIFDSSAFNAVLFAQESTDVMSMVKAKLGIE